MSGQETETASDEAFIRQSWMALLVLLPLPLLSEYSGLDVWIENYCFSPAMHGFPWRDVLWFNVLLHNGLRMLLVFIAAMMVLLLLLVIVAPQYIKPVLPRFWRDPHVLGYLRRPCCRGR